MPALETAHVLAYVLNHKTEFEAHEVIVVVYSGRGDKDLETITRYFDGS
jgi:tryptophan synthase beta subunit